MIAKIGKMMTKREDKSFSYEELAAMLKTSPEALETFEGTYKRQVLDSGALSENFLQWDTATVKAMLDKRVPFTRDLETLIDRIVGELTDGTRLYIYDEKRGGYYVNYAASRYAVTVTNNDLKKYPEELRPQLTGNLVKVDISEPSYKILLQNYAEYKDARDDRMKKFYYNQFRQGLDILDLDDFTYQMLEMNPNTMGFWLPPLAKALCGNKFFRIPDTKILRVPLPMLQLTRLGFETLNPVTKEIVNRYCKRVFKLNEHEIKLDLCRAILELQRGGYIVTKVRALDYDIENVVDVFHLPEFEEARENPMPDIVSGVITSNFDSGASFHLPCKVNKKTREVFAVEVPAQPCGDDSFKNATVNVDDVDRSLLNLNDIVSEYDSDDYDGVLDALYHVQAKNDYWENEGESLTDLIHKYRWYILKDALMQRGRDAVTDFIGTDISSSEFSRVLDETEMVMPDETFEKFWEKYI